MKNSTNDISLGNGKYQSSSNQEQRVSRKTMFFPMLPKVAFLLQVLLQFKIRLSLTIAPFKKVELHL